jgi:hypothetical protein
MNVTQQLDTTTIRQTVTFKASPQDVYETLMDTAKHVALSGKGGQQPPSGRRVYGVGRPYLRPGAAAGTEDRAGLACQGLVARSLFDRDIRSERSGRRHRTALHPNRRPAASLRRPLKSVDFG